jgi:hypothetical protein
MAYVINDTIHSVNLVDGKLEVIRRIPTNMIPNNGDKLEKYVYSAYLDGSGIYLETVVNGRVKSATLIPETFEFDE